MAEAMKVALDELTKLSAICKNHRLSQDSYSAPGFTEFLNRPLDISDIPMESYDIQNEIEVEIAKDPTTTPWEDTIKNFVLDLTSIPENKVFSTYILLTGAEYIYTEPIMEYISVKYSSSVTKIIHISPICESEDEFMFTIVRNSKIEYSMPVHRDYIVGTLVVWYEPHETFTLCHDTSIYNYKEILSMMPDIVWSVSCSPSDFVKATKSYGSCKYICPIYSHLASKETRAIGNGPIRFVEQVCTNDYAGKMNYYIRCIRGSKHSSGRCYDCEVLYRLCTSLQGEYKQKDTETTTKFALSFLNSGNPDDEQLD